MQRVYFIGKKIRVFIFFVAVLFFAFGFGGEVAHGATLSYYNSSSSIADNVTCICSQATITPPVGIATGDLLTVVIQGRSAAGVSTSVVEGGGQTWTRHLDYVATPSQFSVWSATFNGTLTANPVFARSGTANNLTIIMHVFRPSEAGTWAFNASTTPAVVTSSTTATFASVTPTISPNVSLGSVYVASTITVTGTPSGWNVAGLDQYRNAGGSKSTISSVYQIQNGGALATGDTTRTFSSAVGHTNYTISWAFTPTITATTTLSGTLYSDEGVTAITAPKTINVAVSTSTISHYSTTTDSGAGTWHVDIPSGHTFGASTPILVWVDATSSIRASFFTKASSSNSVGNLNLYQNRVIVSHEGTSGTSTSNTNMSFYDGDDDSDIQYTSNSGTLTVNTGNELHIQTGKTYAPGGDVTINANASTASTTDGSFHMPASSIYTAGGLTTIGGNLTASSSSTFTTHASGTLFTATTTGKTVLAPFTTLGSTTFNGSGGAWTMSTTSTTTDLTIASGTLTAPSTNLNVVGSYTNNGSFANNGGTVTFASSSITSAYTGVSFDTAASGNADPKGITAYNGYFWIVDDADAQVYKYTTDGTYTGTSFDTAASGNADPRGITVYNGFFWVIEYTGAEVYKYTLDGTYTGTSFDTAASGNAGPRGIAVYDGYVWVVDGTDAEVYKYTTDGTYTGTSFDTSVVGIGPSSSITSYNGYFWITDYGSDVVYKYTTDGTYTGTYFYTGGSGNNLGYGITAYNGFFWIPDYGDAEIYKYIAGQSISGNLSGTSAFNNLAFTGAVAKDFGTSTASTTNFTIEASSGVVTAPYTNLTISGNFSNATTSGFNANGATTTFASSSVANGYTGVYFNTLSSGNGYPRGIIVYDGFFWIADSLDGRVYKYTLDGTYITPFDTAASGNANPYGIAGYNGFLWVTDFVDAEVYKYTLDGTYITSFDTAASGNANPVGLSVYNGFFWITDSADDEVYQYTLDGTYTGVHFDTAASGNADPAGITAHNGYFWIADFVDDEVYQYTPDGTYITSFDTAASGNADPRGITAYNGYLWVTNIVLANIYQYTAGQSISGTVAGASAFTNLAFTGAAGKDFGTLPASTTNITIEASSGVVTAPYTNLSISGNFSNATTSGFNANSATTTVNGTTQQTLSGTLTGTSAFNNLHITNTSQTGSTTQSIVFASIASTTDTLTMNASTSAQFLASATSTFQNIALNGAVGQYVTLRSSTGNTQYNFYVPGTQKAVTYVDVRDANSCGATIIPTSSVDSGNNTCWTFTVGGVTYTISGSLYSDEGVSLITSPKTLAIAVGTSTPSLHSATSDGSGVWTFTVPSGHTIGISTPILVWVDATTSIRAALFTKASNTLSIGNLNLYQNSVIVSHEGTSGTSTTNSDMSFYDGDDDSDIQFTSNSGTLTVNTGNELHIQTGKTYAPGGAVTINANASTASTTDGSFHLMTSSTYTAGGLTTIGGNLTASSSATYTTHASGTLFTATTTGKTVLAPFTTMGSTTFNGSGGAWTMSTTSTTTDLTITNGTLTAPATTLTVAGSYVNNGTFTNNGGTTYFNSGSAQGISGTLIGTNAFNHTAFIGAGTKTLSSNASTTNLTIDTGATVVAPTSLTIGGNYSNSGSFTDSAGIVHFSSTTAQTIAGTMTTSATDFASVQFSGASTKTFSSNASTTNFTIDTGATVVAPASLTIGGNYSNSGTFTHNSGTTTLNGTTQQTLSGTLVGTSAFNNLHITNTSQTGSTTQSVIFASVASTTDTLTMNASTSAQFLASATSTFQNIALNGAVGQYVTLRSSTGNTQYNFYVPGTQKAVTYVDVRDANSCGSTITPTNSVDSGNNTCWTFAVEGVTYTISGSIYSDEGVTTITSPKTLAIAVGTSTPSLHSATSDGSGVWTFTIPSGHTIGTSTPILVWVDATTSIRAALFTKASNTLSIGNLNLYQNRVIISHEGTSGTSTTNTNMSFYDGDNDSDIQFTSNSGTLTVNTGNELHIQTGKTYAPGGNVTINANASTASTTDGSFHMPASAIYTAGGMTTIGGNLTASSSVTFTTHTSGTLFTATTTGKTVLAPFTTLGSTTFNGSGGAWTMSTTSTTTNLTITNGTLTAPATTLTVAGSYTNNGTFTNNGGTTLFASTTEAQNILGTLTSTSAFNHVSFIGTSTQATTSGLVGHWKLDEGSGTIAADSSGNGNTGTLTNGPVQTTGKIGRGVTFDGTDDHILVGTDDSLDITGAFTFSAWIYPTGFGGLDRGRILQKKNATTGYGFFLDNGNISSGFGVSVNDGSGSTLRSSAAGVISLNTWQHVVASYDGTNVRLYINRTATNGAQTLVAPLTSTNAFAIGGKDDANDRNFAGIIDEVRVYNRGLSATEISELYQDRPKSILNAASTTNFTVTSGVVIAPTSTLSMSGNYTNNGVVTNTGGTYVFSSTSAQSLSGTLTGSSSLPNVNFVGASTKTLSNNASTTNFTIDTGATVVAPTALTIAGNYSNSGSFTDNAGTVHFASTTAQTIAGTMNTSATDFASVQFSGASTKTFSNNASTTNFTIDTGATVVAPTSLTIGGNYSNSGTFTHNSGTTTLNGTSQQTLSGTLTGTSAFNNLHITNTSQTGSTTQSVIFASAASTTDTLTMNASTSAQFLASATSTFQNIALNGAVGQYVTLRSSTGNTQYNFYVPGTQKAVTYVDVRDANSCGSTITPTNSVDSGNNTCWTFAVEGVTYTISGSLYSDEGVTTITSPKTLAIAVGTSTPSLHSATSDGSGVWTFTIPSGHTIGTSTPILVWVDATTSIRAALFTKASNTLSIGNLNLYQNRVIVSHEGTSGTSTTNTNMSFYDGDNDSDIQFTSNSGTLTVNTGNELHIQTGKTYAPGGAVTINANASTASTTDGSFHMPASAIYTAGGLTTIGGNLTASSSSTFTTHTSGTLFTATTTGKTVLAPFTTLGSTTFNGSGGAWTMSTTSTTTNLTITNGTLTAPATTLTVTGSYANAGTFTNNGGTTIFASTTEAQNILGTLTSTSAFNHVSFIGTSTQATTSGLVGHWKLDEGSGTTAVDSSGQGNTGTLTNGPVQTTGKIGRALSFDNSDDIVVVAPASSINDLPALTISAWINTPSSGEGGLTGRIVDKDATGSTNGWRFFQSTGNAGGLRFAVDGSTDLARESSAGVITYNEWEHVIVTWDGSMTATNVRFYVNGVETGYVTTTNGASRISDAASSLYIGNETATIRTWDGKIDDVRVYNRVLSATEITELYNYNPKTILNNTASTTNFTVTSGVVIAPTSTLSMSGNYTNNGVVTNTGGTYVFSSTSAQSISGTLTGSSSLPNVNFVGASTKTFSNNASTTNFTIDTGATVVAPTSLTIGGNYSNSGSFTDSAGIVHFSSTTAQTIAGTMNTSATDFNSVQFSGASTKTFSNNASTTNVTINTGATVVAPTSLTVAGNYSNSGTYTNSAGIVTFASSTVGNSYTGVSFDTAASGNGNPRAVTAYNGYFWVTDFTDDLVYKYTLDGTYTGTSFDTTASGNTNPYGIAGYNGYLWVMDAISGGVYKYTTSGTYTGTTFTALAASGITVYGDFFWISDINTAEVYKYTLDGTYTGTSFDTVASGNAAPHGITAYNGYLWIVDFDDDEVYKYTTDGTYVASFDTATYGNDVPYGITAHNGYLWVTDNTDDEIYQYTAGQSISGNMTGTSAFNNVTFTGAAGKDFGTSTASTTNVTIEASSGVVTAPYTNLTIAGHFSNATTSGFNANGATTTFASSTATTTYTGTHFDTATDGSDLPIGILEYKGFFWITDITDDKVYKYTLDGTYTGTSFDIAASGATDAYGITGHDEHLWVTEHYGAQVYKYTLDGTYTGTSFDTAASGNTAPTGITIYNGFFWIADLDSSEVYKYTLDGTYTGVHFDTAASGNSAPYGVVAYNGLFWIAEITNSWIYKYTAAGTYTGTYFDTAASGNSNHAGITAYNGYLFITDYTDDEIYQYTAGQSISGTATGTSAFNNLVFTGAAAKDFGSASASTTNITIETSSGVVTAPYTNLSISGNFSNATTSGFNANQATTTINGTSQQTLSGTMVGTSAWNNLHITNTSQTGSTTQSVVFASVASTTDTLTMNASTSAQFLASATSTFQNIALNGAVGQYVTLRSSTGNTQYNFYVPGTQKAVTYVDVRDANSCGSTITVTSGVDSGNNTCWDFASFYIQSGADQTFAYGDATTSISTITISDDSPSTITAANDIRIKIATSTVGMKWDTDDTTATFGGTASGKVANPVSYEGNGSVLVIPVSNDFSAGDTLTIGGLSYAQFTSVNTATSALGVYTGGSADTVADAVDSKTVTIRGALVLGEHDDGQVNSNFDATTNTGISLHAFKLTPGGETANIASLAFSLVGANDVEQADITTLLLYRDMDNSGEYTVGDVAVGGSGVVSLIEQTGTITFSTAFQATTTHNYILVGDVANVRPGDSIGISLYASNITSTGSTTLLAITESGSVSSKQHIRRGKGGAGNGALFANEVGDPAPEGQGQQGGGGAGGGDTIDPNTGTSIGNAAGFNAPSSDGSPLDEWTDGGNALSSDGVYATAGSDGLQQSYGSFGFSVPGSNAITGIAVKLEASASTNAGNISVRLSWDGGSSMTSLQTTDTASTTDAVYVLGGSSDTWGHSWTPAEMADGNFVLEVVGNVSGNTLRIDALQVRIYHQASGGGGGGGGAI